MSKQETERTDPNPQGNADGTEHVIEILPGVRIIWGKSVEIFSESGEIIRWDAREWAADPQTVTASLLAVALASSQGPNQVLVDIFLKGMCAFHLAKFTKETTPDAPFGERFAQVSRQYRDWLHDTAGPLAGQILALRALGLEEQAEQLLDIPGARRIQVKWAPTEDQEPEDVV